MSDEKFMHQKDWMSGCLNWQVTNINEEREGDAMALRRRWWMDALNMLPE